MSDRKQTVKNSIKLPLIHEKTLSFEDAINQKYRLSRPESPTEAAIQSTKLFAYGLEKKLKDINKRIFLSRLGVVLKTQLELEQKRTAMKTLKVWLKALTNFKVAPKRVETRRTGSVVKLEKDPVSRQKLEQMSTHLFKFYPKDKLKFHLQTVTKKDLQLIYTQYFTPPKADPTAILKPLPPILDKRKQLKPKEFGHSHLLGLKPSYVAKTLNSKLEPYKVQKKPLEVGRKIPSRLDKATQERLKNRIFELTESTWHKLPASPTTYRKSRISRLSNIEDRRKTSLMNELLRQFTTEQREHPLEKFRRCVQTTIVITRAAECFSSIINDMRGHEADFAGTETGIYIGDKKDAVYWDIGKFQGLGQLRMSREVAMALQTVPQFRTMEHSRVIAHSLRTFKGLKHYNSEMLLRFAQCATYIEVRQRRVILKKGYRSDGVYFIFAGSVAVSTEIGAESDDTPITQRGDTVFLKRGACFGEVGVIKDTPRTSTVTAVEDCQLLVVDKDDFLDQGLHHHVAEELQRKFEALRNIPILSSLEEDSMWEIANRSRIEDYQSGSVIVKDTANNFFLWFVISGSAELYRFIPLDNVKNINYIQNLPTNLSLLTKQPFKLNAEHDQKKLKTLRFPGVVEVIQKSPYIDKSSVLKENPAKGLTYFARDEGEDEDDHGDEGEVRSVFSEDSTQHSNYTANKTDSDTARQTIGTYILLDTYRKDMILGQEMMFRMKNAFRFSNTLISRLCTVIQTPMSVFAANTTKTELTELTKLIPRFPSDHDLTTNFVEDSIWETFKRQMVEETVWENIHKCPFDKMLRSNNVRRHCSLMKIQDPTLYPMRNRVRYDDKRGLRSRTFGTSKLYGLTDRTIMRPYGMVFNNEIWPKWEQNYMYAVFQDNLASGKIYYRKKPPLRIRPPYQRTAFMGELPRPLSQTDVLDIESPLMEGLRNDPRKELGRYENLPVIPFPGTVFADRKETFDNAILERLYNRIKASRKTRMSSVIQMRDADKARLASLYQARLSMLNPDATSVKRLSGEGPPGQDGPRNSLVVPSPERRRTTVVQFQDMGRSEGRFSLTVPPNIPDDLEQPKKTKKAAYSARRGTIAWRTLTRRQEDKMFRKTEARLLAKRFVELGRTLAAGPDLPEDEEDMEILQTRKMSHYISNSRPNVPIANKLTEPVLTPEPIDVRADKAPRHRKTAVDFTGLSPKDLLAMSSAELQKPDTDESEHKQKSKRKESRNIVFSARDRYLSSRASHIADEIRLHAEGSDI